MLFTGYELSEFAKRPTNGPNQVQMHPLQRSSRCQRSATCMQAGAEKTWAKVGKGTLRSSAFLATYCALAWAGACSSFALTQTCTPSGIYLSCWTGGHCPCLCTTL